MALYYQPGVGLLDDQSQQIPEYGSIQLPDGSLIEWGDKNVTRVPEYTNRAQYGDLSFQWMPGQMGEREIPFEQAAPGYLPELLYARERIRTGQASDWDREWYQQQLAEAQAIPARDIGSLQAGWGEGAERWNYLNTTSPDLGPIMLGIADRMDAGTATPQERQLFETTRRQAEEQNYRASVPQESDRFNPLGDNLLGALAILGTGITGGLAAAPLAAGGAGLATTLGSLGTLAGSAGGWAGTIGGATGQEWLSNLGLGLGIAGGLAGGLGGLSNVLGSGVNTLGDAARLAQSAGRITGSLGRIPGAAPLQQASRYLGLAGQLGQGASGVQGLFGAAQGVTEGAGQAAQTAQDLVTQRGGNMSEWDYSWDYGGGTPYDNWSMGSTDMYAGGSPTFDESYSNFLGWGGDERQTGWYQNADLDTSSPGGGGLWNTILGGLGSVGGFLGRNASWLGPAASGLAGIGAGALGSNAAQDAARLQSSALNRGLDLQTAQWLQQQANQAPWLHAGQQALPQLQRLAGQGPQAPFQPGAAVNPWEYTSWLPGGDPGWTPQAYQGPQTVNAQDYRYTPGATPQASQYGYQGPQAVQAGDYRWTPGQGPRAADYRYTPGQTPDAANYRYTPGAVPTLSGAELLANDPGVAFRLQEGRNALEGSAAARGSALSGPALAALQRQGQELSSQEYGNAWQRAAQQAQMREGWQQQATAQNFGQAMSAAQLREQLQQVATQQGWSQAQTEAAFREQMAQQASQQGFSQALGAQGQQWQQGFAGSQYDWQRAMLESQTQDERARAASQLGFGQALQGQQAAFGQGLQSQQWNQAQQQQYSQEQYNRLMGLQQMVYGRAQTQNQTEYERQLAAYNSQLQGQNTAWNQWASLAGLGQTAANQLGAGGQSATNAMGNLLTQLGGAQGQGALSSGNSWLNALQNVGTAAQGAFGNMQFQNQLSSLLAGLNR